MLHISLLKMKIVFFYHTFYLIGDWIKSLYVPILLEGAVPLLSHVSHPDSNQQERNLHIKR